MKKTFSEWLKIKLISIKTVRPKSALRNGKNATKKFFDVK